jgi:hypothetical protein
MTPHNATEWFKLLSIAGLAELPDPDWLIEGMVPVRGFVNLYGPPKSGKSFIALDWGLSIAMGVPWLGHEVRPGPVVYVYWCMARGISPLEFLMLPSRVNITEGSERERLVELIERSDIAPALLIIDTLAKCSGGIDEQSNTEMGRFVDACERLRDRFDCAVMVVHHAGKDIAAGSRGASALPAAIDAQFQVTRLGSKGRKIKLLNEHQRSGAEHPAMWLALVPCEKALVVEMATAPGKEAGEGPQARTQRDKVENALAQYMPNGASAVEWKQAATAAGVPVRTFYNQKKSLIEDEAVEEREGRWFLVREDVMTWTQNPSSATVH